MTTQGSGFPLPCACSASPGIYDGDILAFTHPLARTEGTDLPLGFLSGRIPYIYHTKKK
jgi:hypothetical protein